MKKTALHLFLCSLLFALVGCSNKHNTVKLNVTSNFTLGSAGYTGGLVVSGVSQAGERFVKTTFSGTSVSLIIPDGTWTISVVGWDGPSPTAGSPAFNGSASCGKSTFNLGASDLNLKIQVSEANCLGADFTGSAFLTSPTALTIAPLKIVTCGAFYEHQTSQINKITASNSNLVASSFCDSVLHPADMKSSVKGLRLIPVNKDLNGQYSEVTTIPPSCYKKTATAPNGVFEIGPRSIPVTGLPLAVILYEDESCTSEITGFMFPEGLKAGNPTLYDSIFDHHDTEYSNRLFLSDSPMGKAYSALYALMPELKCGGKFCGDMLKEPSIPGDTLNDSLYDYFFEIDYSQALGKGPYQITFPSTNCGDIEIPTSIQNNGISTKSCALNGTSSVVNFLIKAECSSNFNNICHSPSRKFVLNVKGLDKEIYFSGKAAPITGYQFYEFSHFWQPFFSFSTVSPPSLYILTTTGLLMPQSHSFYTGTAGLYVIKPQYVATQLRYGVSENQADFLNAGTNAPFTPIMLPPNARMQKEMMATIRKSIGGNRVSRTFENDSGDMRAYGTLKKIREMFSNKGPALLLNHETACLDLNETKSITLQENGVSTTYEVNVSNATSSDGEKPILVSGSAQSYGKKLTVTKDGAPKMDILFDCDSSNQMGRLETVDESPDDQNELRRNKEILYWGNDRFEGYSWETRYSTNYDPSNKISERSTFERAKVIGSDIHGRYMESSWNQGYSFKNGIKNYRYRINSNSTFSLAAYDFWENDADMFFPNLNATFSDQLDHRSSYQGFQLDTHSAPHFCGDYSFPALFSPDCSGTELKFDSNEGLPLLPISPSMNYQLVKTDPFRLEVVAGGVFNRPEWFDSTSVVPNASITTNGGLVTFSGTSTLINITATTVGISGISKIQFCVDQACETSLFDFYSPFIHQIDTTL